MDEVETLLLGHLELIGVTADLLSQLRAELLQLPRGARTKESLLSQTCRYAREHVVHVLVSTLAGETYAVEASARGTVSDLKAAVAAKTGIPTHGQRLLVQLHEMEDSKPLVAYNVTPLSPDVCLVSTCAPKICVIGGADQAGEALSCVDVLDPIAGVWFALPPLASRRTFFQAVALDGRPYVLGGEDECGLVLGSVEALDLPSRSWGALPPMAMRRAAFTAVVLKGKIYIMGGHDDDDQVVSSVQVFDPNVGAWSDLPSLATPRERCAAAALGGMIYVIGGSDAAGNALADLDVLDTVTGSWRGLAPMASCRVSLGAAVSGEVLCALGGQNENGQSLDTVEAFHPERGLWYALPPMTCARSGLAAVALRDRLFAIGGYGDLPNRDERFGASAEVFDFGLGAWSALPFALQRRAHLAAVAFES